MLNLLGNPEQFLDQRRLHLRAGKWVALRDPVRSWAQLWVLICVWHQNRTALPSVLKDRFKFFDLIYKELSWLFISPGQLLLPTPWTPGLVGQPEPFVTPAVHQSPSSACSLGIDVSWARTPIPPPPWPLLYVPILSPNPYHCCLLLCLRTIGSLSPQDLAQDLPPEIYSIKLFNKLFLYLISLVSRKD